MESASHDPIELEEDAEDGWGSQCQFDRLLESELSRRHTIHQSEQPSEELPAQWESMPLSAEGP